MAHQRSLSALMNRLMFATCALLLLGAFSAPAHAQSITFAGAQTYVGSGLSGPWGVAVDGAGDVFIADTLSSRVVEIPAGGGPQTTVLASGLNRPYGVAVDGAGDVFIADEANNLVVEVPAGGGPQITVGSGLNAPYGVAVDGAGNVFIADTGNGRVVKVPVGGGSQTTVGSGLHSAYGVAVDGAGDVFIADYASNQVVEVPAGGGPETTVGSGLSEPLGVAVDGAGDVFIADNNTSQVVEVPAGGGPQTTVGSGLSYPSGVAVDGAGDVFIAGTSVNHVVEVQRVVNLGNVNVCPAGQTSPALCSQTTTLNYNVAAPVTFGAINVVTQGAPNLDFTPGGGSTCTGTVSAGSTCTVNVAFAPVAPGARMGAVQLTDNLGNLLVTTMVHGLGQGPAIAFGPGAQTTVGNGLSFPFGVAVDEAGDVFIADADNNRVVEIPAGGGAQTTVGSGLNQPLGVAVDGAGDIFIADTLNSRVVVVPADGGPQTTVGSGLNQPYGVAVDGAGNVFIGDTYNNRVVEVPAGGGPQTTVGSGLSYPIGVAVDGAGDVFIADSGNNRVVEVPAGGGPQTTVGSELNNPFGVAVDGAGDVFIVDTYNNRVVEVPAGGGPETMVDTLFSPRAAAVDGTGDVFIADTYNNRVVEVQRSQPPTLSFASTLAGSTSSDSPQSVTIQNVGNQPLNAVTPGLVIGGPNFLQVAGSGTPADCTSRFSLAPGAACNLSISFEPQNVGNLTAAATFTDNAFNKIPSASQSIGLQGTGQATQTGLGQTITFTQAAPASASYYSAFTVSAQSTSGLTVALSVDSSSTGVCSLGTPSVASGVTSAVVAMQSGTGVCTIDANQAGNGNYTAAAQQQTWAAAAAATTGGTFTVTNTNDSGFGSLRDAIANAASGDTINFSLASPATITLASTLSINTSLTISGPGASNVAISGNNALQVFSISGGTTVTISGVTIENGNFGGYPFGGGIANGGTLTLTNSIVSGNSGSYIGGGIYNYGTLTLTNSTVSGNSASYYGGIYNQGTLTLSNSTVSGNSASYYGGISNYGTLTLSNSTVSGNSASEIGGISNNGTLTLSNSTVSGNSASYYGGIFNYGTLTAKNSIVANNAGGNCYLGQTITSQGHNLSDDASCAFAGTGDLNSAAAGLDPGGLKANGGPTQTIALLPTSPAVDAIPLSPVNYCTDTNGNPVTTDQRGTTRPQGSACDIGAVELNQTQTGQTSQTISFTQPAPASASYSSTFNVAAEATSGLTVTLSVDSASTGVCSLGTPSVVGGMTSATVTMLSGTGTCTIFALQSGNASYKAAAMQQTSATAQEIGQTITFTQAAPASASYYSAFTVSAQSTSGLTVALSVDSSSTGVCSLGTPSVASGVTSAVVAMQSGTGVCTIDANQAGNGNYTAAAQQQTWAAAAAATTGGTFTVTNTNDSGFGSLRDAIANAASGDTINFSLASPATITLASTLSINTSLTISGPGASNVAISGNNALQVFSISGGTTVTISGVTIENGNFGGYPFGGGIANGGTLTLTNSIVSGNSGSYIGGGIYNYGTLTLTNSTVSGNSASYYGGIYNQGTLTLSNSTVSGNSASYYGGISNYGTLTLSNSTVSGNSASEIGGISNNGTLTLSNSTVSGNSASYYGGIFNYGTLTAKNSIVANNAGGNCYLGQTITSQGHNLSDDASCAFAGTGDLNSAAAGLDPGGLKANGGPTQTIALLPTSPAVDAIPLSPVNYCTDTNGNPVTTDQRGTTRPQGSACDIGAVELNQTQTGQTSQTISFTQPAPASASYSSTFNVAAEATSGLTVTLSVDSASTGVCSLGTPSVVGGMTSATVTMLSGTGTCTIFALQSGNASYKAAAMQQTSATAQEIGQTITFTQAAPASASYYSAFTVSAQSTSGLTVALSVDSSSTGVCSLGTPSVASGVTSAVVAMQSGTGVCTIDANQAGNGNYTAAAQQQTWAAAAAATTGGTFTVTNTNDSGFGSLRDAIANAASGDTINFSLASPATITLASTLSINTSLTISGPGASNVAISGNNALQVFSISGGTTVTISGVTIENGNSGDNFGGGIANGGTLTLTNSTVSDNSASSVGGIYNYGTLTLTNSTVSGNSVSNNVGGILNQGTLTLSNSTVSGNSASDDGGGIYNYGTLTLGNSTVSGNSASYFGGGIFNYGTLTAKNSIVANNAGGNCYLSQTITSQGHNLSDDASCGFAGTGDLNSTAAGLDPGGLKANGGPTQTIALLTSSPAVNAIPLSPVNYCTDTNGNPVTTDQRGTTRPQGPACDIGAYELSRASQTISFTQLMPPSATYNSSFTVAATGGASGNPVTFTSSGVCTNSGATYTMTSGTGICSVIANQAGNANYSAAPQVTQAVNATPAAQSIAFTTNAPSNAAYNSSFTVAATGGASGNPLVFTSSGVCTNSGATYTMTSGTGTCSVIANQGDNGNYAAATRVTETVTAAPLGQTITFTVPAPATAKSGDTFNVAATGGASGNPVTFTNAGTCTVSGATYTMTSDAGTCTVIANEAGNNNYAAATQVIAVVTAVKSVTKVAPTVTFTGAPGTAHYLSTFTVATTENSGITPTITAAGACKIAGTTVTMTSGTGTCTLTAKWATDDYYLAASATQNTSAKMLPSSITWNTPAPITYGTELGATLDATATVAGNFAYKANGNAVLGTTVLAAGNYTLSVTFTPTLSIDYAPSTATVQLTVNPVGTTTTITKTSATMAKPLVVTVDFTVANGLTTTHEATGSVTVTANSGETCTGKLAAGKGSCVLTFSTAGSAKLTAAYAGDSNNNASSSAPFSLTD